MAKAEAEAKAEAMAMAEATATATAKAKAKAMTEAEVMLTIKLGLHNKCFVLHSAEGFFGALGCTGQLGPHRPAWLHILCTTV